MEISKTFIENNEKKISEIGFLPISGISLVQNCIFKRYLLSITRPYKKKVCDFELSRISRGLHTMFPKDRQMEITQVAQHESETSDEEIPE